MLEQPDERVLALIRSQGPMPFERYVEIALYDAELGFYATHGQAGGRRGDFVTSVEVGPLFAASIGDWLDERWDAAGRPDQFLVAEAGAGVGTLYRGVHLAQPRCFDALTYTLVERSAGLRAAHRGLPGTGWRSQAALPGPRQHVVMANELLDNLAFGIAERVDAGWAPVEVVDADGSLALEVGPVAPTLDHLSALAPDALLGQRVPVASDAIRWVADAVATADRVLAVDYGAPTAELATRGQAGWLRTFARHTRGNDPLADPGRHDITHDVPFDQLPAPTVQQRQADWLGALGVEQRVEAARRTWDERAAIGDLEALTARSAVNEAQALIDPTGLGAFWVLEWDGSLPGS